MPGQTRNKKHAPAWACRAALLVTALAFGVHLAGNFDGAFVFDDRPNITQNPHVTGFDPASLENWLAAAFDSPARMRPLSNLSFAWQWFFFGENALAFHLINDLLHALAAAVLFFVLLQLLSLHLSESSELRDGEKTLIAASGALLWALHPVQTQAVTYVVQRMSVLAGLFFFAGFALYLRGRRTGGKKNYIGAALCYLLALSSKESAAVFPAVLLTYEWLLGPQESKRARTIRLFLLAIALIPPILMAVGYTALSGMHFAAGRLPGRDFTLWERLLSAPRMYWRYLGLLVLPYPLVLDYGLAPSTSLLSPWRTLPALLVSLALLIALFISRKRPPVVSFCVFIFFGVLAPETTFLNLELFYEHRLYVASAALLPLLPLALWKLVEKKKITARPAVGAATIVLLAWAGLTVLRERDWQSPARLLLQNVAVRPNNARAHYNLGQELVREGKLEEALPRYERAETLGYAEAPFAVGTTYHRLGKRLEALKAYSRALEKHPRPAEVWVNLGRLEKDSGNMGGAEQAYRKALAADAGSYDAYLNLGNLYLAQRRLDEAKEALDAAVEIDPEAGAAYFNRMLVFMAMGKLSAGYWDWEAALARDVEQAHQYDAVFEPFRWNRERREQLRKEGKW